MGSFVKRWGWLAVLPVLAIGVVSWRLGSWESSTARRQAAEAAGVPIGRVEMRDGLNVHLTGFATEAERDAAVARVAALRSSWVVTGDLIGVVPGPGAEVASGPSTSAAGDGSAAGGPVMAAPTTGPPATSAVTTAGSSTTALPTTSSTTVPPSAAAPSATATAPSASGPALVAALSELGPVLFDAGATTPRAADRALLDRAAALLRAAPSGPVVQVVGHTDTDGPQAANQRLGLLRARVVVAYLVAAGVDPSRLEAVGAGEERPVVSPELTPADKERNRRIEWVVGS